MQQAGNVVFYQQVALQKLNFKDLYAYLIKKVHCLWYCDSGSTLIEL